MSATAEGTCQTCHKPGNKLKCTNCSATYYCDTACQKSDWPLHKTRCKFLQNHPSGATSTTNGSADPQPQTIPCVIITASPTSYAKTFLPSTHPIFNTRALPITTKIGYPLVMARMAEHLPRGPATDNQHATWLNIDPGSGFAPEHWQGGIGDVVVASADGTPLYLDTLGAITDYVSSILDEFGEGKGAPRHMYSRAALDTEYLEA
ncbi:Histone-lysine N-methyltransferase [Lachnellula occidentalis]|uniref:Histone-lysine N-methyltransferase n=1 Tax=Lachnellula occidentalis TaxID=215460 RepID=A0A8H8S7S3_9HELO|nr:Histone-lysine N-methyltransferase [Lachnellula occidentalis]